MATIKDVAQRAGVSTATVSNVLTGRRYVSPPLREAVLEAVEALEFRPNNVAKSLRSRRTHAIGVAVPDLTNPFFNGIIEAVEAAVHEDGYQVILVGCGEDARREEERVHALIDRRVDGLILAPTQDDVAYRELIERSRTPTVIVDRGPASSAFDFVGVENQNAACEATLHLIELGHREIAFLASTRDLANIRARLEGYRQALEQVRLPYRRQLVVFAGTTATGGEQEARALLQRGGRPTALFCATNTMAIGAVRAIRSLNVPFPEDISLLSFDDFEWTTLLEPYLTTVAQPVHALGEAAWRLLKGRLDGERGPPRELLLPCELRVRQSTRPPAERPTGAP